MVPASHNNNLNILFNMQFLFRVKWIFILDGCKTKVPRLPKGFQSSTDAYMLVYTWENHNPNLTEIQLPKRLQEYVDSQNKIFEDFCQEIADSKVSKMKLVKGPFIFVCLFLSVFSCIWLLFSSLHLVILSYYVHKFILLHLSNQFILHSLE